LHEYYPAWHPLDNLLAFFEEIPHQGDLIQIVRADGTGYRDIVHSTGVVEYPQWSPNGQMLVFTSAVDRFRDDLDNNYALHVVVNDLGDEIMVQSDYRIEVPAWAPDNRHIAYIIREEGVRRLYSLDICTRETSLLVEEISKHELLSWMP